MNIKLTYRKKNLLLAAVVIVLGACAWNRAFSPTFGLKAECEQLQSDLALVTESGQELSIIQQQIAGIDRLIAGGEADSLTIEQELIRIVQQAENAEVSQIHLPHKFSRLDYRTITNQIDVEGSFGAILTAVNQLEREFNGGVVNSLHLEAITNPRTKQKKLYGSIFIQSLEKV